MACPPVPLHLVGHGLLAVGRVPSHSLSAVSCSVVADWEVGDGGDVGAPERGLGVDVVYAQSGAVWVVTDFDDVVELAVVDDDDVAAAAEHGDCVIAGDGRVKLEVLHDVHVVSIRAGCHRSNWPRCEDLVCPVVSRHVGDFASSTEVDTIDDVTQD